MEQPLMGQVGSFSDKGMRRQVNEDSLAIPSTDLPPQLLSQKGHLYVVADGIGGHTAGQAASDLAVRRVMEQYYADPSTDVRGSLLQAIQTANAEIHHQAQDPAFAKMGTTIVAVVVRGHSLTVAHVGDSRAYLMRGGTMQVLTQDHSWVAEQVQVGLLTPEQARQHQQRHVLTRSLGRDLQVEVDVNHTTLRPGDQVLLCSDGLWEFVEAPAMQQVLSTQPPQAAAQQLVELANQAGGPDNITAIVIQPGVPWTRPTLVGPVERAKRSSAGLQARFRRLPAQRRRAVVLLVAALLLAGLVGLIAFLFWRPLPSLPSVAVAPVRYVVLEGDTLEAVADYFQVTTDTLSSGFEIGQPVTPTLSGYAILIGGQVLQMDPEDDGVLMLVANRSERKQVWVDLRASGAVVTADAVPAREDTVTVVGYPGEGAPVQAMAVDVWQGEAWDTWYHRGIDAEVWVYSAFHDQLVPSGEKFQELDGKQVLLLGSWTPAPRGFRFQWDEQDLFLLGDDDVYVSRLSPEERLSLTERFALTETPVPTPTGEAAEGEQTPTTTTTPGVPGGRLGKVNSSIGLNVRPDASREGAKVGQLADGEQVRILCFTQGEYVPVPGSDRWYRISYHGTQEGYVLADFVELEGATDDEQIPECE